MSTPPASFSPSDVAFGPDGLVPVVAQDAASGEVLMLAWADREALDATLASGDAHYHSRSRDELWRKGASSGHVQRVVEVRLDCDGDALLYQVEQTGPACHTGQRSCFHRPLSYAEGGVPAEAFGLLQRVVDQRLRDLPDGSYVARMHERGLGYVSQKVVEEAGETIVAALEDRPDELRGEAADLLFHLTVLLRERGLSLADVGETLLRRHRERDAG
jgi:phosphoribosyl-ATP pyrophosphohydrolase/phosphoribosyl-AMP cyclohydrolase